MGKATAMFRPRTTGNTMDSAVVLGALASSVIAVDGDNIIQYVNGSAEQLFQSGASYLCGRAITDLLPSDSPVMSLIAQARDNALVVSEYGISLDTPRTGHRTVTAQAAPSPKHPALWCCRCMNRASR